MSDDWIGWVALAGEASVRLSGRARSERRDVIEGLARERGVAVNTVRRALAAHRFVVVEGALHGVPLEAVAAPMSSIETLKRIGKLSPDQASAYVRRTLLGKMSYGSLLGFCETLEAMARDEAADEARGPDLRTVAAIVAEHLGGAATYVETNERSPMARAVRADVELGRVTGGGNGSVVVIAPAWRSPTARGTVEDASAAVLAATLAFDAVYYAAADEAEWLAVIHLLRHTRADLGRVRPFFRGAVQPST